MANAAAKKLFKQNQKTLKFLIMMVLGFSVLSVLHFGYRLVFSDLAFWDYAGFLLLIGANVFCYWSLNGHAKPTFDTTGELLNPGEDLSQKGLMEYYWDVLYLTWFVQVTSILSNWFWFVYLAIPVFGSYKIWTAIVWPLLQARSQANQQDESELDPKDKRRKERAERRRTKVVRG